MFLFIPIPVLARTILIASITILTLLGIMTRPFKLNRFVLDHAPCPVLLVRSLTRGQFPIDPKPPKPPER